MLQTIHVCVSDFFSNLFVPVASFEHISIVFFYECAYLRSFVLCINMVCVFFFLVCMYF